MSDSEPDTPLDSSRTASETPDAPPTDPDADYREEADWGLDDLKASDEAVERYVVIGGRERRLMVFEATNADAEALGEKLDNRRSASGHEAIAQFFRTHIDEPESFATTTAADVEEMRMGVAEKLLDAIAPDTSGNPLR